MLMPIVQPLESSTRPNVVARRCSNASRLRTATRQLSVNSSTSARLCAGGSTRLCRLRAERRDAAVEVCYDPLSA